MLQATATRKIEGTLRDANGVPIPYGQVSALETSTTTGARFFSVRGDGTYTLDGLRPGKYLLRTVVESCPTKLLLANPALDRQRYAELFQLNEAELELVTTLIPRQQLLLKRPDVTKVLSLNVDPKSYWIYTNTPLDNERVAAIVQKYAFEAGLDRLAASA